MNALSHKFIVAAFLLFLGYYVILAAYYLVLGLVGFWVSRTRGKEDEEEDYAAIDASSFTVPVSILITTALVPLLPRRTGLPLLSI